MKVPTLSNEPVPTRAAGTSPDTEPDPGLVARAAALRPLIRERAEEGSREGRVVPDVIRALEEQGLLKLTVPHRYGGHGANSRTLVDVLAGLARGDGSTAWTAMLLNIGNWFATTWPVRVQDEIWGDNPDARCCAILAPSATARSADGGWLVSGRWPYASGSFAATHALTGFLVPQDDGSSRAAVGLFHPGQWSIERSWFPVGMRGTGSDTVVIDEVFVPDHRIQYFDDLVAGDYATELRDTDIRSRAPFLPTGTVIFGAIQVGLGRAALDLAVERLRSKGVVGSVYTRARDSPVHQTAVAEALSKVDAAELLAHRSCRDIDRSAVTGDYPDELARARVRNDTGTVVTLVHEAVDRLLKAAGSGSFLETSPLSRIFQDVGMAGSHVHATPAIAAEVYGRLLLGADGGLTVQV
ncbi:oxidoreductase [Streptomyces sp. SID10853]|uniref:acyl-CoA dehydrogenase family protein n=1 Tax=Streptomyces sp. SID10853 TaxID=2706028 RepID=UPI0013C22672|nr:acyl-CoA dehydrogenase family protein [Streptomyces sp. SID10853]NDZ78637.1 oxidoreductase [Streptomyces sp. SID10853]